MTKSAENDALRLSPCLSFEGLRLSLCFVCGLAYDEHLPPRVIPPEPTEEPR